MSMVVVESEALTVERLGRPVLRDVSLRVGPGECVSIIGPNGAGKSTLMSALLGLLPVISGEVRLNNIPIQRVQRREIARRIAYVPQVHEDGVGLTVRDVVEAGRYVHLGALDSLSEMDRSAIREAVTVCRIGDLMDRPMATLSGGERQKAWIAAALAQQTPMLFLDEPTTSLDPAHQVELIRIMSRFVDDEHTLMVVCHDLNIPIALGGRVLAVRDGMVTFDGEVQLLTDTDRLQSLFGTGFVLCREPGGSAVSIQPRI